MYHILITTFIPTHLTMFTREGRARLSSCIIAQSSWYSRFLFDVSQDTHGNQLRLFLYMLTEQVALSTETCVALKRTQYSLFVYLRLSV